MPLSLQMQSLITKDGTLEVSLVEVEIPPPGPEEVVVRIEASPINPSDLGTMLGPANVETCAVGGTADHPVLTAKVPDGALKLMAGRLDQPQPVGNEGAGVVIEAGSSDAAQALMGKTVAAKKMFMRAVQIKPQCVEAMRELRIMNMRRDKEKGVLKRLFRR